MNWDQKEAKLRCADLSWKAVGQSFEVRQITDAEGIVIFCNVKQAQISKVASDRRKGRKIPI